MRVLVTLLPEDGVEEDAVAHAGEAAANGAERDLAEEGKVELRTGFVGDDAEDYGVVAGAVGVGVYVLCHLWFVGDELLSAGGVVEEDFA